MMVMKIMPNLAHDFDPRQKPRGDSMTVLVSFLLLLFLKNFCLFVLQQRLLSRAPQRMLHSFVADTATLAAAVLLDVIVRFDLAQKLA